MDLCQHLVAFGLLVTKLEAMLLSVGLNSVYFQSLDLEGVPSLKRTKKAVPQALTRLGADALDVSFKWLKSLDDFWQCISLHVYLVWGLVVLWIWYYLFQDYFIYDKISKGRKGKKKKLLTLIKRINVSWFKIFVFVFVKGIKLPTDYIYFIADRAVL